MEATSLRAPTLIPMIVLAWLCHFFVDAMLGIWPVYKTLVHFDLAKAGLIVAAGAFIGEGSQLIFGSFSDRGYRQILMTLGLIGTIASVFFAYSINTGALFGLYLFTCLGSGCFHPAAASLMSSLIPARRGLLVAIFASGGSLGLATSQLLFTHVYKVFEGNTALLALPTLLLAICLFLFRFPLLAPVASKPKQGLNLKEFVGFFKKPHLRSLYLTQVANQSVLWGTIFILPDVLKTLGHEEWVCFGGGHLCFILGAACMMVPAGYLADKYSPRQVMLHAGWIACMAFYFILFTGGISVTVVLLALFVLGSSLALINPIGIALGTRFEPQSPGAISAFLMGLVWCVSEAFGPGGVGILSKFFDDYAPVKALAVLGSFFVMQIYCTICLPKESAQVAIVAETI